MSRISIKSSLLLFVTAVWILLGSIFGLQAQQVSTGTRGMVVSADSLASLIGVEMLKKGGNAVDAAVAVGFTLAVTFPLAGNIGGGGFMVIRLANGKTTTIDFREKAPRTSSRDMYLDVKGNFVPAKSQKGPLAAGIPGSVAGLLKALAEYGTMRREAVLQPAIDLARNGFVVRNRFLAREISQAYPVFKQFPASLPIFRKNGRPVGLGDTLHQDDLGSTLERIKRKGEDGFYKGETASRIVAEMERYGGIVGHQDLETYDAVERRPVTGTYRGYQIVSMGPPSSGGAVLIEMLNIIEGFDLRKMGYGSVTSLNLLAETMKVAYADRAEFLGDPDFVAVPTDRLIAKDFAQLRRKLVSSKKATASSRISPGSIPPKEHSETTHFSVVDRWGNCVSVTTTINDFFGCGVLVEGGGFFLNNEMDDFSAKPGIPNQFGLLGGEANAIEPNKRMLSAMTPTIILKNNDPFLVVGTPGGSRIITTVFQIIVNVVDYRMSLADAMNAPRIHHQWRPDTLFFERGGMARNMIRSLGSRGYQVIELKGEYGRVEGIMVAPEGKYIGVTDKRGSGAANGY